MIKPIVSMLDMVLDRLIPDKNQRAKAAEALKTMQTNGELQLLAGQLEVNKVEAAHKSLLVAGWRPMVGWICAASLGYNYVIKQIVGTVLAITMEAPPELPSMDTGELMPLLLGLLGLAGYRTYEKRQGVSREI